MHKNLVAAFNAPLKHLKANKDWQVAKVNNFEGGWFNKEKTINVSEALCIIRCLEQHWGIYITPIFPEYEWDNLGEAWSISHKCAAINVSAKHIYPSTIIHEISHGIVECAKQFHYNGNKIKDPGHGPLWTGVYAYNIMKILKKDITGPMGLYKIKQVPQDHIIEFREYFKKA